MSGLSCKCCPHCGDWVPLSDPCPVPFPFVDEDGVEEGLCSHLMAASDPEMFEMALSMLPGAGDFPGSPGAN